MTAGALPQLSVHTSLMASRSGVWEGGQRPLPLQTDPHQPRSRHLALVFGPALPSTGEDVFTGFLCVLDAPVALGDRAADRTDESPPLTEFAF